ncbi:hypothetical protein SAMN05216268_11922 [Streptomyces yunnanensis]|uniref:Uncharacterized protein n=1 Tax=Streptomyces yunnanensis TaxID=156453 RepID=A0A9X8N5I1_9ACTN|nr:hypothetical protein SAMN05216268_11922 [Streptomyces yunnanensis]
MKEPAKTLIHSQLGLCMWRASDAEWVYRLVGQLSV